MSDEPERKKITKEVGPPEEVADEATEGQEEAPQPKPLTLDQAMSNIDVACSQFQGNRAQHQAIVNSIKLVSQAVAEYKVLKTEEIERLKED